MHNVDVFIDFKDFHFRRVYNQPYNIFLEVEHLKPKNQNL